MIFLALKNKFKKYQFLQHRLLLGFFLLIKITFLSLGSIILTPSNYPSYNLINFIISSVSLPKASKIFRFAFAEV